MEPMIAKMYLDDEGDVMVEAVGGWWEGCMSHGASIQEALSNFGEAAALFHEEKLSHGASPLA